MKRGIIIIFAFLVLLSCASCATVAFLERPGRYSLFYLMSIQNHLQTLILNTTNGVSKALIIVITHHLRSNINQESVPGGDSGQCEHLTPGLIEQEAQLI